MTCAVFTDTDQILTGSATASIPPVLRGASRADRVADILLKCTGGTPTSTGHAVPRSDVVVFLNTALTRPITPGAAFEAAVLTIDEPHSAQHSDTSILVCGAPSTGEDGTHPGSCFMQGNGSGISLYDGSAFHPNLFHGKARGPNQVAFLAVPIDPPGPGATRTLRISNIWVDRTWANNEEATAAAIPTNRDIAYPNVPGTSSFVR